MEQEKNFSQDYILDSASGYCMPFKDDNAVKVQRHYGEQPDGSDFSHGMVFDTSNNILHAVADGRVTAVGSDAAVGLYVVIQYGCYEVQYGYLTQVFANFGQQVSARRKVAVASDKLYLAVKLKGEEMDPRDFIRMLYGNVVTWSQEHEPAPEVGSLDLDIHTRYDEDREQIEDWMTRFYANYFMSVITRRYVPPQSMFQSLLNLFRTAPEKGYFYEDVPSGLNPLGLGRRSIPLIEKVQNLLIGDFLNYMALQHGMYLPGMSDDVKKKVETDAIANGQLVDPLAAFDIDIQCFDIPRLVSVYGDKAGIRWFTKAWFNNREDGEAAVEIEFQNALRFIHHNVDYDEWLEEYFPKQMAVYHQAIEQTREQLIQQLNNTR